MTWRLVLDGHEQGLALPDASDLLPGWLTDSSRYRFPLEVAAAVAISEVRKRRRQDAVRGRAPTQPDDDVAKE